MELKIETKGFDNTRFFLESLSNMDLMELLHETADKIIDEARSNLQNNTNIDSGTLLSSISVLEEGDNSITVGSREPYAGYIEYGRGPVRPLKEGGWLHWIDKSSGKDVFAKFANATEPMPFLEPAVIIHTDVFPDLYIKSTEEMVRRKSIL
jgi:hypothetical protein